MEIKIQKINEEAEIPKYQTEGSAGMDVHSTEAKTLKPNQVEMIPTGLKFQIPKGYELQIRPRSGLAKKGITLANSPGTIDSDYRGQLFILLQNLSKNEFKVEKGMRIAQILLKKVEKIEWRESQSLEKTERGEGGFGSTGA